MINNANTETNNIIKNATKDSKNSNNKIST